MTPAQLAVDLLGGIAVDMARIDSQIGSANYVPGRMGRRWVLNWQHGPAGVAMAEADGFVIEAFSCGTFRVVSDVGEHHHGRAKNHSLNNAMNAAEKWWAANKESLREVER